MLFLTSGLARWAAGLSLSGHQLRSWWNNYHCSPLLIVSVRVRSVSLERLDAGFLPPRSSST